jgi:hypothetical protein
VQVNRRIVRGSIGLVLAGVGLLLAACGASPPSGVASIGKTSTTTTVPAAAKGNSVAMKDALSYAQCMRSHGVPKYPDPTLGPNSVPTEHLSSNGNPSLDPNSPRFQAAEHVCLAKQPAESPVLKQSIAANQLQDLKYAACMRAHGVPNFPDPTMRTYGVELKLPPHVSPDSPLFLSAQRTCMRLGDGPAPF